LRQATIREAVESDAEIIAHIDIESRRTAYRGILPEFYLASLTIENFCEQWRKRLQDLGAFILVAENESAELIGFVFAGRSEALDPDYVGEIYAIYILPDHQQHGVGRELMRSAAERFLSKGISSLFVWVLASNPARAFYEALGGTILRSAATTVANLTMESVAYGWKDTTILRAL